MPMSAEEANAVINDGKEGFCDDILAEMLLDKEIAAILEGICSTCGLPRDGVLADPNFQLMCFYAHNGAYSKEDLACLNTENVNRIRRKAQLQRADNQIWSTTTDNEEIFPNSRSNERLRLLMRARRLQMRCGAKTTNEDHMSAFN